MSKNTRQLDQAAALYFYSVGERDTLVSQLKELKIKVKESEKLTGKYKDQLMRQMEYEKESYIIDYKSGKQYKKGKYHIYNLYKIDREAKATGNKELQAMIEEVKRLRFKDRHHTTRKLNRLANKGLLDKKQITDTKDVFKEVE